MQLPSAPGPRHLCPELQAPIFCRHATAGELGRACGTQLRLTTASAAPRCMASRWLPECKHENGEIWGGVYGKLTPGMENEMETTHGKCNGNWDDAWD